MKNVKKSLFVGLFFLVLTLFHQKLYAQSWCNEGATWNYDFQNGSPSVGFVKIKYLGDTLIDSFICQKLSKTRKTYNNLSGEILEFNFGTEITRISNNVVLIKNQTLWDTLYNFNANPGQSWRVTTVNQTPGFDACGNNANISVLDTGHLAINGIGLRYLKVSINLNEINTMPPISEYQDTIFERIGFKKYYLLPIDICYAMIDGNEGGFLRCFSDNNLGLFQPNFISDCNFLPTSTSNNLIQNRKAELKTFIDGNHMYILNKEFVLDGAFLSIFNLQGALIKTCSNPANGIDLADLAHGSYLLVLSAGKENYYGRVVHTKQ
jgi:hypothetical protein